MKLISIGCDGTTVAEEEIKDIEFIYDGDGEPYILATLVDGHTYAMDYGQLIKITDYNPNLKPFDRTLSEEEAKELGIVEVEDEMEEEQYE